MLFGLAATSPREIIKNAPSPTGIADTDTDAVQNLIDSFEGKHGVVRFRSGTYVLGQIVLPSNITLLRGQVLVKDGLNQNLFRNANPNAGNTNINLIEMVIDGNAQNQTDLANPCHAIGFYNCNNCLVDTSYIYNTELDGVYIGRDGSIYGELIGGHNRDIQIKRTVFEDIRRNGVSITRGHYITIDECQFLNCNLGYFLGNAGYNAGAIDLERNEVTDIVQNITISNSYFESYASSSIQIAVGEDLVSTQHIRITNNDIYQTNRFAIVGFGHTEDVEIDHNNIYCTASHGIWSNPFSEEFKSLDWNVHHNNLYGETTDNYVGVGYNYTQGVVESNHITRFSRGLGMYLYTEALLKNNTMTSCTKALDSGGAGLSLIQEGNVVN